MGLAENVLRHKYYRTRGTHLNALRLAAVFAKVTFERYVYIRMNIYSTKRTGIHTSVTTDAAILMYLHHSVLSVYHICWTGRKTLGILALIAHNRHTHHRMGIYSSDTYPGFFGVIYLLPVNGTGHLTYPTTGTFFRHYCYFASH
jgi:hypothetical protein